MVVGQEGLDEEKWEVSKRLYWEIVSWEKEEVILAFRKLLTIPFPHAL